MDLYREKEQTYSIEKFQNGCWKKRLKNGLYFGARAAGETSKGPKTMTGFTRRHLLHTCLKYKISRYSKAGNTLGCVCVRVGVCVCVRKIPMFLSIVEHTTCVCAGVQNCFALRCVRKQYVALLRSAEQNARLK